MSDEGFDDSEDLYLFDYDRELYSQCRFEDGNRAANDAASGVE